MPPSYSDKLSPLKNGPREDALRARSKSLPKPSSVYPVLWRYAVARQAVYLRRVAGSPAPWTDDHIIASHRFTNAFRAADRVSQDLIGMVYSDANCSAESMFLRVLLFKIFNKTETWNAVVKAHGLPEAGTFPFVSCEATLSAIKDQGKSIYSAAYIMPSGGQVGGSKHQMHLRLLRRLLDDRLPDRIQRAKSLSEVYGLLLRVPTFGPFLAFQYAIDLNYSPLTDHSETDFVVAGPGALDGLAKCFESLGDYTPEETIMWLTDVQEQEFARYGLSFPGLWGRRLQPIDVQNLFCEVSKYTRVSHPDVRGASGRTRIKQKFSPAGSVPPPVFPPKWKLEANIAAWLDQHRHVRVKDQGSHPFLASPRSG